MRWWEACLLGASIGGLAATFWFFRAASKLCAESRRLCAEANRFYDEAGKRTDAQLDALARIEEWTA